MSRDSRLVLPLDARDQTLPIPRWQFGRMVVLDAEELGDTLTWTAAQDDVLLARAVDVAATIAVRPAGETVTRAVLLAGQAVALPVRAGEVLDLVAAGAGRLEVIPFDRSGDAF